MHGTEYIKYFKCQILLSCLVSSGAFLVKVSYSKEKSYPHLENVWPFWDHFWMFTYMRWDVESHCMIYGASRICPWEQRCVCPASDSVHVPKKLVRLRETICLGLPGPRG